MTTQTILTKSGKLIFISQRYWQDKRIVIEDDPLGHFLSLTESDVDEIVTATGAEEFILKETAHVQPVA